MSVDLQQWEIVRKRLLRHYCRDTRDSVLAQLSRNNWRGDHGLYITRFSQAGSRAVFFPPEKSVDLFLSKLPMDMQRQLTSNGTICYQDWEDAAEALSKLQGTWCAKQAAYRRCLQNMDEALNKEQARLNHSGTAGVQQTLRIFRCRECQGVNTGM